MTSGFRGLPQALHGVHDLAFLREERLAELPGPVELLVHAGEQLGKGEQGLDARVPVPVRGGAHRFVAGQSGVGARPARRLHDFQRVGRGHEHLGQQGIRIQRDRSEHLLELCLREGRALFRAGRGQGEDECCEQDDELAHGLPPPTL